MLAKILFAKGINLECLNSTESNETDKYTEEICQVQCLFVFDQHQIIDSQIGKPEVVETNVKFLLIENQVVNFIPKGIEKFLPNLNGIMIRNSELRVIEKNDIAPFEDLLILDLSQNNLVVLANDLFEANQKLTSINFSDNQLKLVGENILKQLENLTKANFKGNRCINKIALSQIELEFLKHYFLENCSLPIAHTTIGKKRRYSFALLAVSVSFLCCCLHFFKHFF